MGHPGGAGHEEVPVNRPCEGVIDAGMRVQTQGFDGDIHIEERAVKQIRLTVFIEAFRDGHVILRSGHAFAPVAVIAPVITVVGIVILRPGEVRGDGAGPAGEGNRNGSEGRQ